MTRRPVLVWDRLARHGGGATPVSPARPPSMRAARGARVWLLVAMLGLLAARPAAAQTEVIEYYGHDALGSIRIVFSASGVATARADYEPFGEAVTIAGMPTGPLPAQQFTGQERDALESQDYFGARYYRPRHGRFSQVDPVWGNLFDPQALNRYRYARSNPLSFVDPDGRNPTSCFDFAGAVRCVGEGTTVTAPLPRPITPTSPAQPPDPTAAAAEALAAMNNSCLGDGNSRACGSQGRQPKRREGDGEKRSTLLTVSVSGGAGYVSGEFGVVLAADPSTLTVDVFTYGGLGRGVNVNLGLPVSGSVNVELGSLQQGVDLAGPGWQASVFAAALFKGVSLNAMGSGWPTWPPHAGNWGWSGGLGVGGSFLFTHTRHEGTFDVKKLVEALPTFRWARR